MEEEEAHEEKQGEGQKGARVGREKERRLGWRREGKKIKN